MFYPFGPRLTKQEEDTYWNFIIIGAGLFALVAALATCFIFGMFIYLIATK